MEINQPGVDNLNLTLVLFKWRCIPLLRKHMGPICIISLDRCSVPQRDLYEVRNGGKIIEIS